MLWDGQYRLGAFIYLCVCVCVCVCSKGACNLTKQYVAILNKCLCFYSVNKILSSTIVFNILYLWSNTCSFGEHEMAYKYTKLYIKKHSLSKIKVLLLPLMVPWRIVGIHRTVLFIIFSGNRFLRFFLMFFTLIKQWFFLRTVRWKILYGIWNDYSMASLWLNPFGNYIFQFIFSSSSSQYIGIFIVSCFVHCNLWNNFASNTPQTCRQSVNSVSIQPSFHSSMSCSPSSLFVSRAWEQKDQTFTQAWRAV